MLKPLFALLLLLVVSGASAQDIPLGNGLEVDNYKAINIRIEELNAHSAVIGLTEQRIRTKAELKLRQAGLRPQSEWPATHLYVNISVLDSSFSTEIAYRRPVFYYKGRQVMGTVAPSWTRSMIGTHGGDPEFIIQSLDTALDMFLNEYLEANAQ